MSDTNTVPNSPQMAGCQQEPCSPSFVIVYHKWWMDRGYFEEEVVSGKTRAEVEQYAAAKCHSNQSTFTHWAFHVVKATVQITTEPKPLRLTLWGRLNGAVSPENASAMAPATLELESKKDVMAG